MRQYIFHGVLPLFFFAIALTSPLSSPRAKTMQTERISIINDLSTNPQDPASLWIATHYGLLRANPNGEATLVQELKAGLMSLAVHPENDKIMLTSGHATGGKGLGVMKSTDGGESWAKISVEAGDPAAFYFMDISRADPNVVYGVSKNKLQISRDGGRSWKAEGKLPEDVFGLAASSLKSDSLYAATKGGLLVSRDGGAKWSPAYSVQLPTTMVQAASGGRLYAFVFETGLITAKEPDLDWKTLSKDFMGRYLLNLAVDPNDAKRLYATMETGAIMTSGDGGKTWISFEGSHTASAENIAKGKKLYENTCQECHGAGGVGEDPKDPNAKDEFGYKAPPLNNDAHAWHHSDKSLMSTILKGSSRNKRMVAFKDSLSGEDVENLVAYIKSLWSFRSLACQGVRHMSCMKR